MKTVRLISAILFYLSRVAALLVLATAVYATIVVILYQGHPSSSLPMQVFDNGSFRIYFPFTKTTFLLGDYTASYFIPNLLMIAFYGLFLWLLGGVFHAFRQEKLFTRNGVVKLSRFYLTNLIVPAAFLVLLAFFGHEIIDILRITLVHLVIGVFAYFMAAIFKQGVHLQEEQDLTF
jgi:hypothetical protein